jgi:hypothetical protein
VVGVLVVRELVEEGLWRRSRRMVAVVVAAVVHPIAGRSYLGRAVAVTCLSIDDLAGGLLHFDMKLCKRNKLGNEAKLMVEGGFRLGHGSLDPWRSIGKAARA